LLKQSKTAGKMIGLVSAAEVATLRRQGAHQDNHF
jgi:hypothetical protein